MHDVIVVGSGAAGVAAAFELADRGIAPLILDVGHPCPRPEPDVHDNLYDHRAAHDGFDMLIGADYRGLSNLLTPRQVPVKLTTPNTEYVTRDAEGLSPIIEDEYTAIQSFAMGGLANAWGAGLYRFTQSDLEGFPYDEGDLEPYFDKLTQEIGISGTEDDMTPFFGPTRFLLPPIALSSKVSAVYRRYLAQRRSFEGEFYLGHPRIAVLTEPKDGRPALRYDNLEFWQNLQSTYTPRFTLQKLIAENRVSYRPGLLARSWSERSGAVCVEAVDVATNETQTFDGRHLLLAAGAINTSRIVLRSFADFRTELPLEDNPALQIPLVVPGALGKKLDTRAFGLVQLNLMWMSKTYGATVQGSLMEITSPMRAEFFGSLPFAAHANLALIKHLVPAMLVLQIFFPGGYVPPARLSLHEDGRLRIRGRPNPLDVRKAKPLVRILARLGALTQASRIVRVPPGHAVHYASTLPMKVEPDSYQCDPHGRLHGTERVYVADSASFPRLPAKNMSFGMMAHAMRIASGVADRLREES